MTFQTKDNLLVKYEGNDEEVVIPETVTEILDGAFDGCQKLKKF